VSHPPPVVMYFLQSCVAKMRVSTSPSGRRRIEVALLSRVSVRRAPCRQLIERRTYSCASPLRRRDERESPAVWRENRRGHAEQAGHRATHLCPDRRSRVPRGRGTVSTTGRTARRQALALSPCASERPMPSASSTIRHAAPWTMTPRALYLEPRVAMITGGCCRAAGA